MAVGTAYEKFLSGLEKAMKVNEMRLMKEPNYSKLRATIRNPALNGDIMLRVLLDQAENLGINQNSFNMVHEGFWDLYCKKPATTDLTTKKLENWYANIVLKVFPYQLDSLPADVTKTE